MIGDWFVFDTAAHVMNLDRGNALGPAGQLFLQYIYEFHSKYTPEGEPVLPLAAFLREWTPQQVYEMVFEGSDTDMLVAQPLPMPDLFADGLSSWEQCAALASLDPQRIVFWGTVNPLEGPKALDLMERQVWEFGAKAFKLYNTRYDEARLAWRMDDEQIAFPVLEKCQELGVDLVGVHKGVPLALQSRERAAAWDMDKAAETFADLNFVIFHVGLPFIDELCWQLTQHPNLYVSLAATVNLIARAPRQFAEILGKLLFWCGEDKIVYGSDTPIWHPQWALKAFCDFEMPHDLVESYGYPPLDETAKRKILGENLLRLHGLDVESTKANRRRAT